MNAKQLFCKWEKSADGRLATRWYALLSSRLNGRHRFVPIILDQSMG